MSIRVKVLNGANIPKVKEKDKPKILTPKYVRQINRGISYRISQSQAAHAKGVADAQIEKSVFD